jgi:hypothetical protein
MDCVVSTQTRKSTQVYPFSPLMLP